MSRIQLYGQRAMGRYCICLKRGGPTNSCSVKSSFGWFVGYWSSSHTERRKVCLGLTLRPLDWVSNVLSFKFQFFPSYVWNPLQVLQGQSRFPPLCMCSVTRGHTDCVHVLGPRNLVSHQKGVLSLDSFRKMIMALITLREHSCRSPMSR